MRNFNLKKISTSIIVIGLIFLTLAFTSCNQGNPTPVEARAVFELNRVYVDGQQVDIPETEYIGSRLTFIGEERGGNVIIKVGDVNIQASINPSREHPSYEDGYWHHHLYAGITEPNSPRINFLEELPHLGIDDNNSNDNTQSAYQRGNLHYIVTTGEFRLRFTIGGVTHDLIFVQN